MKRENENGETEVAFVWDVLPDGSGMGWVEFDPISHAGKESQVSWKVWNIDFGWLPW